MRTKHRDNMPSPPAAKPEAIAAWLRGRPPGELVDLIMDRAAADPAFFDLLSFKVAAETAGGDSTEMRKVLKRAMTIRDFVSWRESHAYSNGVFQVLGSLRDMLGAKPGQVVPLAEYALELWEEAIERIDDSNGCMSMILGEIHHLHLEACQKTKPEPLSLADRLLDRHLGSGWDIFANCYDAYGSVLGEEGRARFRTRVEAEWKTLPHHAPGQVNTGRHGRPRKVDDLMLEIAEETKEMGFILSVMSRDLSEPYRFLNIVERCRQAGAYDLARQWAEAGVQAFPGVPDYRLYDLLAEEYVRDDRPEDAVSVIWESYEARVNLERYQALAAAAAKARDWPAWRSKALEHARREISGSAKKSPRRMQDATPGDHSLLVEIFLWEKDIGAAWQEACEGGCWETLWLQLAAAREREHPADAAAIHRRQVEPLLNRKNKACYQAAVDHLDKVHHLMVRMGREVDFQKDILSLKTEWRRLRNFIQCMERKPWGKPGS